MRQRSLWMAAGLMSVLVATVGWAQDAPPPVAAPAGEGIKLTYKFRPGAVYRYHFSSKGTMTLDMSKMMPPGAAGQVPGSMPMDFTMQLDLVQKVKSVDADGTATVNQSMGGMQMTYRMMGMNMAAKMQNGKMTFTMNGQPMPPPPNLQGGNALANANFESRIAPTGRVLEVKGQMTQALRHLTGGQDMTQMFGTGLPGLGMLVLPAEAVAIGQMWENQSSMPLPLPLPGAGAGGDPPKMEMKMQHTLKELQQKGARQIAVIDSKADLTAPRTEIPIPQQGNAPGPTSITLQNFSQSVTGTNYFDVTSGALSRGEYSAKIGMQMQMAMPGAPGGQPGTMGMDGVFSMATALQPNTPPKAAAPVRKAKPVRKSRRGR